LYAVEVIERAAAEWLPYHIAHKKEKLIDENGEQVIRDVDKFERFVFDALLFCDTVVLFDYEREKEFAPIKNGSGAPADSPDTARDLVLNLDRKWADAAGIVIAGDGPFEVLPETSYDGEGLERYLGFTFVTPWKL
jgi:UDP-N-acetylglucosamine/UDP-N-acetylgalactosamine diphosphorylase